MCVCVCVGYVLRIHIMHVHRIPLNSCVSYNTSEYARFQNDVVAEEREKKEEEERAREEREKKDEEERQARMEKVRGCLVSFDVFVFVSVSVSVSVSFGVF